jgi:hypothetical protein
MTTSFKIDKNAFIALAAALAAAAAVAACQNTASDEEADGGAAGMTAGGSSNSGGADQGGATAEGGASYGGATAEGGASYGGATAEGGASYGGAPAEGGAGGAAACDDTVGSPACEGVSLGCDPYCQAAVLNLKPGVAVAAITCLETDTSDYCDTGYGCLSDATADGCAEDVAADCTAAEGTCGEASDGEPACATLLSAFNDAARAEVVTCLESETCYSVYSCAEGMFFESP